MIRQEPPFAVQIEPVEGCPLRCTFCGLNGIRGKKHDFKFMEHVTARTIARSIRDAGWNVRLEMAMHGEPTRHPKLHELVDIFHNELPDAPLLITSNGAGLVSGTFDKVCRLFEAGVTTLAIDEYQGVAWAQKIREGLRATKHDGDTVTEVPVLLPSGVDYYEYPAQPKGNPHRRVKRKRLVLIAPIDQATEGTHSSLNNHAGCGAPLNDQGVGKRCAKPFRELAFRYDGSVAICCNDWRGVLPIGNIHDMELDDIWQHPRMQAARRMLYHRQRDMPPCVGCDATSYRVGLLPDKMGKVEMPLPNKRDLKVLAEALADGPLTEPVLRQWEK